MKKIFKLFISAIIVTFSLFSFVSHAQTEFIPDNFIYLSDGNDGFCVFDKENNSLLKIDKNGTKKYAEIDDTKSYSKIFAHNGEIYLLSEFKNNSIITTVTSKNTYCITFSNVLMKDNCFLAESTDRFYVTDRRYPDTLLLCDSDGIQLSKIKLDNKILSLFYCDNLQSVVAETEKGFYIVTKNKNIACPVPYGKFTYYNNTFCDEKNNVYSFDENTGTEKLYTLPYEHSVLTQDGIYCSDNTTVYLLDFSGKESKYFNAETKVYSLLSGKNSVAFITDNGLQILDKKQLLPVSRPVPQVSENSEKHSKSVKNNESSLPTPKPQTVKNNENSSIKTESTSEKIPDYTVFSNTLRIAGNYIFLDKPLTVAQLKKSFDYNDNTVSVINHNGKETTSGKVGTSWQIIFTGNTTITYNICLMGDVTGEGNINSNDVKMLTDYLFEKIELNNAELYAADVDEDSVISLKDLYSIFKNI